MSEQNIASQVLGYISIACSIVCTIPQFVEMYKLKSSEGTAILFLMCWLCGDTMNILGLILTKQWYESKTSVLTACWYVLSDLSVISAVVYYDHIYHRIQKKKNDDPENKSRRPTLNKKCYRSISITSDKDSVIRVGEEDCKSVDSDSFVANNDKSKLNEEANTSSTRLLSISLFFVGMFMLKSADFSSDFVSPNLPHVNSRSLLSTSNADEKNMEMIDPYMFHQANLRFYDNGDHSLLTRWIDAVLKHVFHYNTFPILSHKLDDLEKLYRERVAVDACGVKGNINYINKTPTSIYLATTNANTCEARLTITKTQGEQLYPKSSFHKYKEYGVDKTFFYFLDKNGVNDSLITLVPEPSNPPNDTNNSNMVCKNIPLFIYFVNLN
eukprot:Pgem_evm1s2045